MFILVAVFMVYAGMAALEKKFRGQSYTIDVTFEDAKGLAKGVDVRINGIVEGVVADVERPEDMNVAVLHIKLRKGKRIPVHAKVIASKEGLIGEKVINIKWTDEEEMKWAEEGHVFQGEWEEGFDELVAKAAKLMTNVESLLSELSRTVDEDLINQMLTDISEKVIDSMDALSALLSNMNSLVGSNSDEINKILKNVVDTTEDFKQTSEEMKKLVSDPVLHARLDNITAGLEESVANLQSITANVNDLASDPELQKNIKDSARLTAETLEDAKGAIGELRGTLNSVNEKVTEVSKLSKIDVSGRVGGRYVHQDDPAPGTDENQALADVEMQAETRRGFVRVGVEGIGEDSTLNLQGGRRITPDLSMRGGIVRSKIGLGMDYRMGRAMWSLNGYDPNDPKINSYLGFKLNSDYSLRIGVEDAFGEQNLMAGLTFEF